MKIMKLIQQKACDMIDNGTVTIAFLGDSVTQGCFELYKKKNGEIDTVFDKESAYHKYLSKMLSLLYPNVPINIINAGISGGRAPGGLKRLERDVLRYSPDLVVVCFGLNDCNDGLEKLSVYIDALRKIFQRLKDNKIEVIFMTPNMMNTDVSDFLIDDDMRAIALQTQSIQTQGILEKYLEAARVLCHEEDIIVCDCYRKWKTLFENGVDVTELLSNKINHPSREMNWLFAMSLFETMLTNQTEEREENHEDN